MPKRSINPDITPPQLRAIGATLGLTNTALAKALGIKRRTLLRYLAGTPVPWPVAFALDRLLMLHSLDQYIAQTPASRHASKEALRSIVTDRLTETRPRIANASRPHKPAEPVREPMPVAPLTVHPAPPPAPTPMPKPSPVLSIAPELGPAPQGFFWQRSGYTWTLARI